MSIFLKYNLTLRIRFVNTLHYSKKINLSQSVQCRPYGAICIQNRRKNILKGYIEIRKEICKECHLCISVCNRDCIVPSTEYNLKGYHPVSFNDNGKCNGCSLCAIICPDVAIEVYRD